MDHEQNRQAFLRDVTRELYFNNRGTIVSGSVLACLMSLLLWETGVGLRLPAWLVLVLAVYVGRYLLTRTYFRSAPSTFESWLFRFRAGVALQSTLWGLASALFFPAGHPIVQMAFLFTLSGLAAGGAIAFGIDLVSVFWFEVPLTLPLLGRFFAQGTYEFTVMGLMVLLYLGYLGINLMRSSRTMRENISLRLTAASREEEIRNQNTLLNTILESEPECVKVVSLDGTLAQMNRAGLAMLEVDSLAEANQTGLQNFVHPDHRADFQDLFSRVCQGMPGQLEFRVIGKRGTELWLDTSAAPLRNASGNIIGLLGVTRNITGRKQTDLALHKSEQRYRTLSSGTFEGVVIMSQGRVTDMNDQLGRMLGYERQEMIGRSIGEFVAPEDRDRVMESVQSGEERTAEFALLRKDGSRVQVEVHGQTFEQDGVAMRMTSIRDITGRMQAEREVRIAATAFESQEGMMITDEHANILRVNKAFTDITGYIGADVMGKNPRFLNSGRHDKRYYEGMWRSIVRTGSWAGEIWNRRKNGEIFPEYLTITSVKDSAGNVINYVGSLTDITQRKESEDEIQRLAFYDQLTLLPNRRLFMDRLQQAIASGSRKRRIGALLFIDLDNFKNLNDTLGHAYGDQLLRQVSMRLTACVREGDTVARLGGDEFVVLLEDMSSSIAESIPQIEMVGKKILELLGQSYSLYGTRYTSTPSIGVTLVSGQQIDAEGLLKQADIAMYQAKKSGRNTLRFFDQRMQEAIKRRASLESDLRSALEKDQILLYYQVQKTSQDKAVGAEALIRWEHPERGMVPPSEFVPLAEETGLILPIGQKVIEMACAQIKKWEHNALTRNFALAVNVSARQFHQSGFAGQLEEVIRRHAINPGRLKLELTESLVLQNIEETVQTMSTLNRMGVQISLDDFGTGYSSLQYLKRLPLDQLKIDQSFVRDIAEDGGDLAIVQTIIAMADSMGLDVIAEGVETERQRKLLLKSGCTHFQGYLFGRPLPIDQFEATLA